MGLSGIYTALSGAIAQSDKLDTVANNIANVSTPGFKKEEQAFKEYLTPYEKQDTDIKIPRIPASIESFYDMNGGDKSYVDTAGTYVDFSQGGIKPTNNKMDLALEGPGFFEVLTPQGVLLTRDGSFTLDAQGRLVTKDGYPVLQEGSPAQNPNQRVVQLNKPDFNISEDGTIEEGGVTVGKLSMVEADNRNALLPVGGSLYSFKDNQNPNLRVATQTKIHQGFLEDSNVNIIKEMTDMITANRTFETNQKAIQAYDSMNGKLVNEVSKIA